MKQTAVEWFAKELNNWRIKEFGEDAIIGIPTEVFEQAKAMEKEKRIKAHQLGYDTGYKVCEMKFNGLFKSE
jgi:hypothetical protein